MLVVHPKDRTTSVLSTLDDSTVTYIEFYDHTNVQPIKDAFDVLNF